jgi:hypothetical protein
VLRDSNRQSEVRQQAARCLGKHGRAGDAHCCTHCSGLRRTAR